MSLEAKSRFTKIFWLLLLGWSVVVIVLLFRPGSFYKGVLFFKGEDHVYHYILFTIWSFLVFALGFLSSSPVRTALAFSLIIGIIFSVGTELLQVWIPERNSELMDLIADFSGIFTGMVIAYILKKGIDRLANKYES